MIITVDGIKMDLLTPWAAVGPGREKDGTYARPCAYVENSAGGIIGNAHGFGHGISVEHIEAVARIMAAAPDLLAALEGCIQSYEEIRDAQPTGHLRPDPSHIHNARRAIHKSKEGVFSF